MQFNLTEKEFLILKEHMVKKDNRYSSLEYTNNVEHLSNQVATITGESPHKLALDVLESVKYDLALTAFEVNILKELRFSTMENVYSRISKAKINVLSVFSKQFIVYALEMLLGTYSIVIALDYIIPIWAMGCFLIINVIVAVFFNCPINIFSGLTLLHKYIMGIAIQDISNSTKV